MAEGTALIETEDEPLPFFLPENKHDAGLRISQEGRLGRRRHSAEIKFDKRILKEKKRLTALEKQKDKALRAIDASAWHAAFEFTEYLKRCWDVLTKHGATKLIRFWSGEVDLRNLPDRAVVTDSKAFMAEARRKGKARLLIRRGAESPNLAALNDDLQLAATFKTVTIEQKSAITIRPKRGWGMWRAYLPRKMTDSAEIQELLGEKPLEWEFKPRGDET